MKRSLQASALALGVLLFAGSFLAHAQSNFPENRPIQMVVGFSPGGVTDLFSRILATRLSEQLGTSVVVLNKPGANSNIAAQYVANGTPDGHTLFFNTSAVILNPALGTKQTFVDAFTAFTPIAMVGFSPYILVAPLSLPPNNVREFIEYAKARPGKLNYSSGGIGNVSHIGNLLFQQKAGITANHVPYKGGGPALAAILADEVQFCWDTVNSTISFVRNKRIKGLAVASLKRLATVPDVPTVNETVIPGFELTSWYGVMAPAKTPASVIQRLHSEIISALRDPGVLKMLAASSVEPNESTPQQYAAFMKNEFSTWSQIIKNAGLDAK